MACWSSYFVNATWNLLISSFEMTCWKSYVINATWNFLIYLIWNDMLKFICDNCYLKFVDLPHLKWHVDLPYLEMTC